MTATQTDKRYVVEIARRDISPSRWRTMSMHPNAHVASVQARQAVQSQGATHRVRVLKPSSVGSAIGRIMYPKGGR